MSATATTRPAPTVQAVQRPALTDTICSMLQARHRSLMQKADVALHLVACTDAPVPLTCATAAYRLDEARRIVWAFRDAGADALADELAGNAAELDRRLARAVQS